jgi:hypothetical protein
MDLAADKGIALHPTFLRLPLKIKALKEVPEGVCKHCDGTGNGEQIADLGEARCYASEFPVKQCKPCGGSGMAIATVKITAVGLLLLCLILLAVWLSPWQMQLVFMSSVASVAALEAIRWHFQSTGRNIKSNGVKQSTGVAGVPHLTGPTTDELMSLSGALESNRQTVDSDKSEPTVVRQTSDR